MIAGHFGLAAGVKAQAPRVPLWALMVATVWLDIVFVPLLLLNIETVAPVAGETAGYGRLIIHADYTHSVVGALVLSAIFGIAGGLAWGRRAGVVLALVSISHWLLDLLVHRMDLPWLPANYGDLPRLGLGLWQYPLLTAAIELALVAIGAWLYWGATRKLTGAAPHTGTIAAALILIGGVATLALDFTGILG